MLAHGSFGDQSKQLVETTKCHLVSKGRGGDHFTSTIFFMQLKLKFEQKQAEEHHMLLKVSPEDPVYRRFLDTDVLFHNEALMYTEVIPFMKQFLRERRAVSVSELFAKCYYAKCGAGGDDIVVLEDMRPRGFRPSAERLALDYDHCAVALRHLGRYHAVSYAAKKLEASAFRDMASKFKTRNLANTSPEDATYFLKTTSYRAVRCVEARHELDQAALQRLKALLDDAGRLFVHLMEPREPLAVLCHGDFCRNNILFRYKSGKPHDVILFDFQTVTYASPAIDLSLFMYLNTSPELRAQHWDELFATYHTSLTGTLADILGCSADELLPDYGLEKFQKEFADYGLHGYLICSFFLPEMMVDRKDQVDLDVMCRRSFRELTDAYSVLGGELASQKLADILKHLASIGGF
jgi:hypothetical protein